MDKKDLTNISIATHATPIVRTPKKIKMKYNFYSNDE